MAEATFYVLADPPSADEPVSSASTASPPAVSAAEAGLFGQGLLAPLRQDPATGFAAGVGVALVKSAVAQVLGVRADDGRVSGELPWRPEFGCLLESLRFMNMDASFAALARTRVIGAVAQWEPRAQITGVRSRRGVDGEAYIDVAFDVVQSGTGNVLARDEQLSVPLRS